MVSQVIFPWCSPPKICILLLYVSNRNSAYFQLSPTRATCPNHLILFDLITCVLFVEQYALKLFTLQYHPVCCYLQPLMLKCFPRHPILEGFQLVLFPRWERSRLIPISNKRPIIFCFTSSTHTEILGHQHQSVCVTTEKLHWTLRNLLFCHNLHAYLLTHGADFFLRS